MSAIFPSERSTNTVFSAGRDAPIRESPAAYRHPVRRDPRWLCESCGYDLKGRAPADACTECGALAGDSLPERRTGSPWQRRPGPGAWVRTLALVALSPRACWGGFVPEVRRSVGLLVVTTGTAAALIAASLLIDRITGIRPKPDYVAGFFLTAWLLMIALSVIEYLGIRFFGGRRGWRIDAPVAACVVSHAGVGWLGAAALVAGAWQGGNALRNAHAIPQFVSIAGAAVQSVVLGLALSAVLGIVVYELFVYSGVRAMRFANAPRDVRGSVTTPGR